MATEEKKKEAGVWADLTLMISTINGEQISYPKKLNLGKELKIRAILSEELSPLFQTLFAEGEEAGLQEKAFSFFLKDFHELMVPVLAIILEQAEDWILENIDGETAEEVIRPFLSSFFRAPPLDLEEITKGMPKPPGMPIIKPKQSRSQK